MKHLVLLFLVLAFSAFSGNDNKHKAPVKNISSRVISANGEEVAGVKITVKETGESVFTDLDGNFKLQLKTDKTYSVVLESIGYVPKELKSTELFLFSDIRLQELK